MTLIVLLYSGVRCKISETRSDKNKGTIKRESNARLKLMEPRLDRVASHSSVELYWQDSIANQFVLPLSQTHSQHNARPANIIDCVRNVNIFACDNYYDYNQYRWTFVGPESRVGFFEIRKSGKGLIERVTMKRLKDGQRETANN